MKSLRALLQALYSLLQDAFRGLRSERPQENPRPARGPALPTPHTPTLHPRHAARPEEHDASRHAPTLRSILRERAARPPLPPHLAAILASAPEVEPEFARRPTRRPTLLNPLHRIAAKVRVYNPRPAVVTRLRALPVAFSAWGERLRRAFSEIHAWLAFDTAPPSVLALRL